MKVIGLTGGIATGVTTVAQMFRDMGAIVVEADQIAREVVEPGTGAYQKIVGAFGKKVVGRDGTLEVERAAEGCPPDLHQPLPSHQAPQQHRLPPVEVRPHGDHAVLRGIGRSVEGDGAGSRGRLFSRQTQVQTFRRAHRQRQ